ncbi:SPOR domain-containing protein [Microbulbifer sp. 2201CG32-9]|uniref:SPOR domain-containing protein n=1 Tax=Microbulbifer sp. 2201CG32-9 TaxID=3232309 RepID=UPI00345C3EA1
MASRGSDPVSTGRLSDGFKQRLVGALVLVALGVIFLPSLFDREGARYVDATSQIPPAPEIQPIAIADPVPVADAVPTPEPEQVFQPGPGSPDGESSRGEQESTLAEDGQRQTAGDESAAEKESPPLLDADGLPQAWVVQVASYRDQGRAEQLRGRLMDEGYKAYTRPVTTARGRFVRVFVGPKLNRADAQLVKQELDQLLDIQTLVLRFRS